MFNFVHSFKLSKKNEARSRKKNRHQKIKQSTQVRQVSTAVRQFLNVSKTTMMKQLFINHTSEKIYAKTRVVHVS